jgi:hypothetical protein
MWYNFNNKLPREHTDIIVFIPNRGTMTCKLEVFDVGLADQVIYVGDYDLNSLRKLNALWTVEPKESLKF